MFLQMFLFCMLMSGMKPYLTITTNYDAMNEKKYSWLALGDSYTIGESVLANERFPAQAIALLQAIGLNFSEPHYIATTGWTTQDLLGAIEEQNPEGPYDVVSLLIG